LAPPDDQDVLVLGGIVASLLDLFTNSNVLGGSPLATLFWLATIIPDLAVAVRRFHDADSSGWWILLGLIPFIGMIEQLAPPEFGPTGAAAEICVVGKSRLDCLSKIHGCAPTQSGRLAAGPLA
jgi:uncharacterized membrane protein YhaH (DUF805 family)